MYPTTVILRTMLEKARSDKDKEKEQQILDYISFIIGKSANYRIKK